MHATGTAPASFPVLFLKRAAFDQLLADAKQKSLKEIEDAINDKTEAAVVRDHRLEGRRAK